MPTVHDQPLSTRSLQGEIRTSAAAIRISHQTRRSSSYPCTTATLVIRAPDGGRSLVSRKAPHLLALSEAKYALLFRLIHHLPEVSPVDNANESAKRLSPRTQVLTNFTIFTAFLVAATDFGHRNDTLTTSCQDLWQASATRATSALGEEMNLEAVTRPCRR